MSPTARVGCFVLSALVIFSVAVFLIGEREFLFSSTYRLYAEFDTVSGLCPGAAVRVGGVVLGTVHGIQVPDRPKAKVLVVMNMKRSTRDAVRKDSVAQILTEGLMGAKFVEVSFGSAAAKPVEDGDTIRSQPPVDFSDLMAKTDQVLDSTRNAMANVEQASADLKSITGKINHGEGTLGQLVNNRQVFENVNQTMAEAKTGATAFQENMEALKKSWFFRGFYKDRGYQDPSELTKNEIAQLPQQPNVKKFMFSAKDIFKEPTRPKLENEKRLQDAGKYLETNPFKLATVVAYTGPTGEKDKNLQLSEAQALIVRNYLVDHFRIDDSRVKIKGMGEDNSTDSTSGRVEILIW